MKIEAEIIEGNPAKRIIQKLRAREDSLSMSVITETSHGQFYLSIINIIDQYRMFAYWEIL